MLKLSAQDGSRGPALGQQFVFRRLDPAIDIPRSVRLANEVEAVDQVNDGTTEDETRADLRVHKRISSPNGVYYG